MKKWVLGILVFGGVACTQDPEPTDFFQLEDRTTYQVSLTGTFQDSLYFKNDTLQQWEFTHGTEQLNGVLYVNSMNNERNFVGYIAWDDGLRSYQTDVIRQLFTVWDTSDFTVQSEVSSFQDSLVPVIGRLRDYSIGFRNDTLPLLLSSKNLQFEIEDQTASRIDASAGYQVRSTLIDGHPDSSEIYYYRRFWNLDELKIRTP